MEQIAAKVGQLTVFQRSANWIVPRNDYAYPKWAREMFHEMPFLSRVYRSYLYWMLEKNFMAMSARVENGRGSPGRSTSVGLPW